MGRAHYYCRAAVVEVPAASVERCDLLCDLLCDLCAYSVPERIM